MTEETLKQFKEWNESGWSKSETPNSEALILAIQAIEKQVPKKVTFRSEYLCGNCNVTINDEDSYCFSCGQRQDWSDE